MISQQAFHFAVTLDVAGVARPLLGRLVGRRVLTIRPVIFSLPASLTRQTPLASFPRLSHSILPVLLQRSDGWKRRVTNGAVKVTFARLVMHQLTSRRERAIAD